MFPDTEDHVLWYALNRLITNYWADVDENWGRQAHAFYLPEAIYAVGDNRFQGEENIRAYYTRRRELGDATTRHLVSNIRVFRHDAHRARVTGVMSLHRAEGRPPVEGAKSLAMIADFEAQCVFGDDRLWRLQSHVLQPIFVGADRPFSMTVDPERVRPRNEQ
jgi:hypothetical protein